jgi:hypothetical protein
LQALAQAALTPTVLPPTDGTPTSELPHA